MPANPNRAADSCGPLRTITPFPIGCLCPKANRSFRKSLTGSADIGQHRAQLIGPRQSDEPISFPEYLLISKDTICGLLMIAVTGHKFVIISAVRFELGDSEIFLNCARRLFKGKDSEHQRQQYRHIITYSGTKRAQLHGYLGGSFRARRVGILSRRNFPGCLCEGKDSAE